MAGNGVSRPSAAALLAACAVGPDYTRPPVVTPDVPRSAAGRGGKRRSPTRRGGRRSRTRRSGSSSSRRRSPATTTCSSPPRACRRRARRSGWPARSSSPPSATRGGSSAAAMASRPSSGSPDDEHDREQPLLRGALRELGAGHLGAHPAPRRGGAWRTFVATEDARRGVLLTLVSDVAQNYFELLALDAQLEIARDSVRPSRARTTCSRIARVRRGLPAADLARPGRARRRPGERARAREPDRGQGEPDQHPARPAARADSTRPADVRPARRPAGVVRRCRPGCPRPCSAPARSAPGRAADGGRQRPRRRGQGGVLSQAQPDRPARHGEPRDRRR